MCLLHGSDDTLSDGERQIKARIYDTRSTRAKGSKCVRGGKEPYDMLDEEL